jgi:hypothetical protein
MRLLLISLRLGKLDLARAVEGVGALAMLPSDLILMETIYRPQTMVFLVCGSFAC